MTSKIVYAHCSEINITLFKNQRIHILEESSIISMNKVSYPLVQVNKTHTMSYRKSNVG